MILAELYIFPIKNLEGAAMRAGEPVFKDVAACLQALPDISLGCRRRGGHNDFPVGVGGGGLHDALERINRILANGFLDFVGLVHK
jgi:hypothetical protein